jgi:8-oxo-dGTP diphosphatase
LIRELHEELGIDIAKRDLTPLTFASHAYPDFHLLMPVYLCRRWQGSSGRMKGQELSVKPDTLHSTTCRRPTSCQDRVARSF